MRIAVCFSGQLRNDYKLTIEQIRKVFPTADFFFGTWSDQPQENFINRYYDLPEKKYHAARQEVINTIKAIRKYKASDWDIKKLPTRYQQIGVKEAKKDIERGLKMARHRSMQNFQHIAHAWMVRDFIDRTKYDIIVRCRYDVYVYSDLRNHIKDFCEQVYEYRAPYGFYTFNDYNTMDEFINPTKTLTQSISLDCHDFMIIHRADQFDPLFVQYMYDTKKLKQAEAGWYQTLCEPYGLFAARVNGFVRMSKQHEDQNKLFEQFRDNKIIQKYIRYNTPETMGVVVDDLDYK